MEIGKLEVGEVLGERLQVSAIEIKVKGCRVEKFENGN